jgi:hypothetical protein
MSTVSLEYRMGKDFADEEVKGGGAVHLNYHSGSSLPPPPLLIASHLGATYPHP